MSARRRLSFRPSPDYSRLDTVLRRRGRPDRIPLFELFSNIQDDVVRLVYEPIQAIEKLVGDLDPRDAAYADHYRYMYSLGYDYLNIFPENFSFPMNANPSAETREGKREYITAEGATIRSWDDFHRYPWPVMSAVDYGRFERLGRRLPEGMRVIAWFSGILEYVMWLLGFDGTSYLLYDDEALVTATFEAVGNRMIEYYDTAASFDCVAAIAMGEDMGFNTATMLSPDVYRKHLFPYHRRLVEAVHRHGKPIILHTCGNVAGIMDDIIACGWDAKHSFEDSIQPVWEAQRRYGDRIALLGGFDMDKLSRMAVEEVRSHTRFMIRTCGAGGGWAMGTGNSVPAYVPAENFIAMIEETMAARG